MRANRNRLRTRLALGLSAFALLAIPAVALAAIPNAVIGSGRIQGATVLENSRGHAVYLWTKDPRGHSGCYGDCLSGYSPVLTGSKVFARKGSVVNQKLLGMTRRRNGKLQVTYNHHPLYTDTSDTASGNDYGQGCGNPVGGGWWLIDKRGNAVKGVIGVCQGY